MKLIYYEKLFIIKMSKKYNKKLILIKNYIFIFSKKDGKYKNYKKYHKYCQL